VELAGLQVGPTGLVTRTYLLPAAAPVIGYASLRYGTGGLEAAFDDLLRGEVGRSSWEAAWADLLHRPPQGGVVRLTLDADLQVQAMQVLAGQRGAVVLLDAETGDVLAMASSPTFDPARLEADWDLLRANAAAPLLNRATQGLYQPGAALETVVLAEALSQGTLSLSDPLSAVTTTLRVDGVALTCLGQVSDGGDWASAYRAACPGPFAALGAQMGEEALRSAVVRWGLTSAPSLEIPTEAGEWASRGAALEAVGAGRADRIAAADGAGGGSAGQ
jgi:peptidoglycan glycosyltransferase